MSDDNDIQKLKESSFFKGVNVQTGDYLEVVDMSLKNLEDCGYFPTSYENRNSYIAIVCKETKEVIVIKPNLDFPKHRKEFDDCMERILGGVVDA